MGAEEGQQTVTMNETKGSWLGRNDGRKTEKKRKLWFMYDIEVLVLKRLYSPC